MRTRTLIPLLVALAALLVPAASASAVEIGLNMNGGAAASTPDNWKMLEDTRAPWARHFLVWQGADTPDAGYDDIVANEERRGIKTLLVVTGIGIRPDSAAYARFVGRMAERYKGRVDAYEIWNEADEGGFWAGGPDVNGYVSLLKQSYTAIKRADPAAKVVFSPLVGNNYEFVEKAYKAGAKGYFDVMAVHTDTACLVDGPQSFYRDRAAGNRIARFTFLGYREVRDTMIRNGDNKPVWMTEFGWSATPRTCDRGRWAGQKKAGVSEETQAQFLREAYHCLKEDPYLEVAMWFNSRDLHGDGSELDSYGLRRADGSARPAYEAFKDVVAGRDAITGPCGDFGGPRIQVISPQPNQLFGDDESLRLSATSPDDDITRLGFTTPGRETSMRNFTRDGGLPLDFSNGPFSMDWFGARDLPLGRHEVRVVAVDKQGNESHVDVPIRKVSQKQLRTLSARTVSVVRVSVGGKGLRRKFFGRVTTNEPYAVPGKVMIQWQKKRGKKWKTIHRGLKNANRPFRVSQTLRLGGVWRARAVYQAKAPWRRATSCWVKFSTAKSKRARCSAPAVGNLRKRR